jgi:AbrB family looped-hinge helix DNA binding protein
MNEHIPGTKIAERLFSRPQGATMAEVVTATGGRQHNLLERLKARGFAIRSRKEGRTTRYWAEPPRAPCYDAVVTSKGQVTVPKEVRTRLGLREGGRLRFVLEDDRVVLKRPDYGIDDLFGMLGKPPRRLTLDQIEESIPRAVLEKYKSR